MYSQLQDFIGNIPAVVWCVLFAFTIVAYQGAILRARRMRIVALLAGGSVMAFYGLRFGDVYSVEGPWQATRHWWDMRWTLSIAGFAIGFALVTVFIIWAVSQDWRYVVRGLSGLVRELQSVSIAAILRKILGGKHAIKKSAL